MKYKIGDLVKVIKCSVYDNVDNDCIGKTYVITVANKDWYEGVTMHYHTASELQLLKVKKPVKKEKKPIGWTCARCGVIGHATDSNGKVICVPKPLKQSKIKEIKEVRFIQLLDKEGTIFGLTKEGVVYKRIFQHKWQRQGMEISKL